MRSTGSRQPAAHTRPGAATAAVAALAALTVRRLAAYRSRARLAETRMRVLADIAEVAVGRLELQPTAQAVAGVLVPRVADLCLVDLVGADGEARRVAAAGDEALADAAGGRRTEVPLVARARTIGVLTLATRAGRDRIDEDAVRFTETLAGRVALALDNAALSSELSSTEAQLQTILGTVDAAIMARDVHGRLVYANQAAADLLRLPDPEAIAAASSAELMDRFEVFAEDGTPVDLADLPGTRVLMGEPHPPPIVVRNVVKATGEERWLLTKATAVNDAEGRPLMAINLIEDISDTKRGELAQRLLAEAAREVSQATGLAGTLQAIADAAAPGLADWAGVDLLEPSGRLRTVALAHRDPERARLGWRLRTRWPVDPVAPHGAAAVVRSGEPELIAQITDEVLEAGAQGPEHLALLRELGLRSSMVVPLLAGTEVLGALSFVSSTARRFDDRDLDLAADLGRQAGLAIKNARLNEERAHIARTLQAGLLPETLPAVEGWEVSGVYRAAGRLNEVGGDFYDVVRFGDRWAVLIGDVVGKGAEAAAVTALVRHTMGTMIEATADPAAALAVLNRRLRARADRLPTLCTLVVAVVSAGDEVALFCAGHPLPLLRREGEVTAVGRTSLMLGVQDELVIRPDAVRVRPGDQMLLYTDGVIDALGRGGRFGEQRLMATLAGLEGRGTEALANDVLAEIDAFASGDQSDDIAILTLGRTGAAAVRSAAA